MTMKSLQRQVGGDHYKVDGIEPAEYNLKTFGPEWVQGNIVKYITRYKTKNGVQDLLKIKHYVDMLLEHEYNCDPEGFPYLEKYEVNDSQPVPSQDEQEDDFDWKAVQEEYEDMKEWCEAVQVCIEGTVSNCVRDRGDLG